MKVMLIATAFLAVAAAAPSPDIVVSAEHDFAREVAAKGYKRGFLAFAAPDGIVFRNGPVNARADLEKEPDGPPENPPLGWWPDFAGIARSGDLGFTSGPATVPVRYFTVWKKQPDGSWKWIYDGGTPLAAVMPGGPQDRPFYLPPATAVAGSAQQALAEVAPLEARLTAASVDDARQAPAGLLAKEALVAGGGLPSYAGKDQAAALARRPAAIAFNGLGSAASEAGDLVFIYGEARWQAGDQPRTGHYVRIWQDRAEGWRLVADVLIGPRGG